MTSACKDLGRCVVSYYLTNIVLIICEFLDFEEVVLFIIYYYLIIVTEFKEFCAHKQTIKPVIT